MTNEEIVSLYSAEGKELRFKRVAAVPMDGKMYVVLAPIVPFPGMRDNQALVFEVTGRDGENAALSIVTDTAIIFAVYEAYGEMTLRETDEKARKKDFAL